MTEEKIKGIAEKLFSFRTEGELYSDNTRNDVRSDWETAVICIVTVLENSTSTDGVAKRAWDMYRLNKEPRKDATYDNPYWLGNVEFVIEQYLLTPRNK